MIKSKKTSLILPNDLIKDVKQLALDLETTAQAIYIQAARIFVEKEKKKYANTNR